MDWKKTVQVNGGLKFKGYEFRETPLEDLEYLMSKIEQLEGWGLDLYLEWAGE